MYGLDYQKDLLALLCNYLTPEPIQERVLQVILSLGKFNSFEFFDVLHPLERIWLRLAFWIMSTFNSSSGNNSKHTSQGPNWPNSNSFKFVVSSIVSVFSIKFRGKKAPISSGKQVHQSLFRPLSGIDVYFWVDLQSDDQRSIHWSCAVLLWSVKR